MVFLSLQVLHVAVPEEYGIVHRYSQLQYCSDRLCDICDLTHENVRSQVVQNRHTDTYQEDDRYQIRVKHEHHCDY